MKFLLLKRNEKNIKKNKQIYWSVNLKNNYLLITGKEDTRGINIMESIWLDCCWDTSWKHDKVESGSDIFTIKGK